MTTGPDPPVTRVREVAISEYISRVSVTCTVQEDAREQPLTFEWTDKLVSLV